MKNRKRTREGSEVKYDPRIASRNRLHPDTYLCVDVKTWLKSDRVMKPGKDYRGVMRHEADADEYACQEHFTFVETLADSCRKRNPQVFNGRYVTITQRKNGELHPNFKDMKTDGNFTPERYSQGVASELMWALLGLVGESGNQSAGRKNKK